MQALDVMSSVQAGRLPPTPGVILCIGIIILTIVVIFPDSDYIEAMTG